MPRRPYVLLWAAATIAIDGGSGTVVALPSEAHRQLQTCSETEAACGYDMGCFSCSSCESSFRGSPAERVRLCALVPSLRRFQGFTVL